MKIEVPEDIGNLLLPIIEKLHAQEQPEAPAWEWDGNVYVLLQPDKRPFFFVALWLGPDRSDFAPAQIEDLKVRWLRDVQELSKCRPEGPWRVEPFDGGGGWKVVDGNWCAGYFPVSRFGDHDQEAATAVCDLLNRRGWHVSPTGPGGDETTGQGRE